MRVRASVVGVFLTHHKMWLGQYPPEFFSFMVLWVAGDLFQYLQNRRKRKSITRVCFKPQELFFTPIAHTYCTNLGPHLESDPNNLTVPSQTASYNSTASKTNIKRRSTSQGSQSRPCPSSCPFDVTWFDVSSSYVVPGW